MERPRMFRGMPDSELEPAVVLTLNLFFRTASIAVTVEVLPAEPVTPMMTRGCFLSFWINLILAS